MKRLLLIALGLAMLLTAASCAGKKQEPTPPRESEASTEASAEEPLQPLPVTELSVAEHLEDVFRPLGRTYVKDGRLQMDFACSGIHFRAECEGDVKIQILSHRSVSFTVYVDGERSALEPYVDNGTGKVYYTVAKGLERGVHEFRILDRTQFIWGNASFGNVRINGSFLERPAERELFLEFYGDSILNGSNVRMGGSNVLNSDATQAFGFVTAELLGADMNLVGCGGLGLTKNKRSFYMRDLVEYAGAQYSLDTNDAGGYLLPVPKYDFARIPDAVVFEIGVNDGSNCSKEIFKTELTAILEILRANYGGEVPIVFVLGYTGGKNYNEAIPKVIESLGGESAGLYICWVSNASASEAVGGDGTHPNIETSRRMAEELSAYLRELLDLK